MKKILIIIVAIFLFNSNAQNNIIVQQNQTKTSSSNQDEEVCVNGVPISEDIGGVECALTYVEGSYNTLPKFTNYNDFVVTVNFEVIEVNDKTSKIVRYGTIVLKAGETKDYHTKLFYRPIYYLAKLVVRPLGQKAKATKSTKKKRK